ncbi:MAG: ABC transporter ATP-binding protein [Anaerolineales bacterium]|nr:ABC transporter ATP-binding protein [Anaerolineales bacterium]
MASIELKDVYKIFELQDGPITALQDVRFEVGEREFVSLIGPSGCGKSTVLRMVSGLIPATKGEIFVHGLSPAEARQKRLYAFVFQDPVMFPWRSVIRNVEMPLEIVDRQTRAKYAGRAKELLKLVGLQGFDKATPNQLSGGMKQRAAIARALLLNPQVLLMDEPFGALDEINRDRMNMELLRIWQETDASILFVTHSIEEAVFLSDRIVMLSPRPGTVYADIKVDIPRPRTLEIKESEESFKICAQVRRLLSEATRSALQEVV